MTITVNITIIITITFLRYYILPFESANVLYSLKAMVAELNISQSQTIEGKIWIGTKFALLFGWLVVATLG